VLTSCADFPPTPHHLWCCTKTTCVFYQQKALAELGYTLPLLDPSACYGAQDDTTAGARGGSSNVGKVTAIAASVAALALLVCIALLVVLRHRKQQAKARRKEAEMKQQMSNYQQQLEKEKEQSKNEKAELQKMKAQYKMLAMDLLANTGGSGEKEKVAPPLSAVRPLAH
jgi:preprotein translocase subunit SecG